MGRVGCGWPLTVCSAGEPKAEWLALKLPSRELAGKRKHAFDDAQVLMWEVSHEGETVVSHSVSPPQPAESAWLHGLFLRSCGGDPAVSPNTGTLTLVRPGHLRLSCVQQHLTTLLLPLFCPFTMCALPPLPPCTIRSCTSHLWQNVFFQDGRLEKLSEDVTNEEHASCYKSCHTIGKSGAEWHVLCGPTHIPAAHLEATRRTVDVPVSLCVEQIVKDTMPQVQDDIVGPQIFENVRSHQRIVEHNDLFPVSQVVKYRVQERISQPHVEVPVPQMVEDSVEATQLQQALLRSADCLPSPLSSPEVRFSQTDTYMYIMLGFSDCFRCCEYRCSAIVANVVWKSQLVMQNKRPCIRGDVKRYML